MTNTSGATLPQRSTLTAFLFLVIFGGANAVAVRFSNAELAPFWGASLRFAAASLLFWIILFVRKIPVPKGRSLAGALIFGVLSIGAFYSLVYWGLVYVPAGLTTVVLALGPLFTFFLAWIHGQEIFRWRGLAGALIAFSGILLAVGDRATGSMHTLALLAILAAAACAAEASVIYKGFPQIDPMATNAIAVSIGAIFLLVLSYFSAETWQLPSSAETWVAYLYLVIVGSVIVFYLYLIVLDRWTASATSYAFLLFPVAATIISTQLTDEIVGASFILGGGLVLLGVWIGALTQKGA